MAEDDRDNPSGDGRDEMNTVHVSPGLSHTHPHRRHEPPLYGVMAEFEGPNELVAAARQTYEAGYRRINGYSPYPIEELSEAIGFTHTSLPLIVFIGGLIGGLSGFFMQYWIEVIDYPLNVGGKPYNLSLIHISEPTRLLSIS